MFAHPLVLIVNLQIYEKKQDEFCFSRFFLTGEFKSFMSPLVIGDRDVLGLFFRGFRTTTEGINSRERCGRVGGLPAD